MNFRRKSEYCLIIFQRSIDKTLPRCITLFECICSKALQSWTKYFQIVLSGINLLCFLKCLIILDKSPASASSKTIFSSFSSINDARYLITFGWFNCCNDKSKFCMIIKVQNKNNSHFSVYPWIYLEQLDLLHTI